MQKLKLLLGSLVALAIVSCEGPAGPPGPPGIDGLDGINGTNGADGINILGQVLEIEGTFDANNNYSIFYEFPSTVEVFESDAVFVYLLWEQVDDPNGGDPIDVWRLLPQTRILDQGLLQYNYDHTFLDVSIFLESDFDLATLPAADTDNQVFRIVIVPTEFSEDPDFDPTNLDALMSEINMGEDDIQRIGL